MARQAADIMELWADLSAQAGLSAAYEHDPHWLHRAERRFCQLERFAAADAPALVLKQVFHPQDTARFAAHMEAQEEAATLGLMPRILARDDGAQAVLMEETAGERLFHILESSDDPLPWLTGVGAWLAAYHRSAPLEERPFWPKFNIRRTRDLLNEVREGRPICQPEAFRRLARETIAILPNWAGLETFAARQHGDMNLHNLLWDGTAIRGIDITNATHAPVGYDIARFLIHYSANLADHGKLRPGHALPARAEEAFFEGYNVVSADDPSVQVLLRARILNDWVRFPARFEDMPVMQQIRFRRARMILESLNAA